MSDIIFRGGMEALVAGDLDGSPDIRYALVTEDFTAEPGAQTLSDFATLGEYDGSGYTRVDAANVAWAYDSGSHEQRLTTDSGSFGSEVAASTKAAIGLLVYLDLGGSDGDNVPIRLATSGSFPVNGTGANLPCTPPADGVLVLSQA